MAVSFKGAHFPKEVILMGVRWYIDGSDANEAVIKSYNAAHSTNIIIRQVQYLNNVVAQDHRADSCIVS